MSATGPADESDKPPAPSSQPQSPDSTSSGEARLAALSPVAEPRDPVGWLDVPLFPFHLAKWGWRKCGPDVRSTVRVIVWVALITGIVWLAFRYGPLVVQAVVGWKSSPEWEAFLIRFVTSPAAAGAAALLAAIIAAGSFARGLKHTKQEAQAKAWWEQFEWVSDRVVPKDPKQERLHHGLATALLGALEATAGGAFQREAVAGIRHTYIRGTAIPLNEASLGELNAQLREVRTFAEASWIDPDQQLQTHFQSYSYLLEMLVALRSTWKPEDVILMPPGALPAKLPSKAHAVIRTRRRRVVVSATSARNLHMVFRAGQERLRNHMTVLQADCLVVVTLNTPQRGVLEYLDSNPGTYIVQWHPDEGPAALRERIETHIESDQPVHTPPANDGLPAQPS